MMAKSFNDKRFLVIINLKLNRYIKFCNQPQQFILNNFRGNKLTLKQSKKMKHRKDKATRECCST